MLYSKITELHQYLPEHIFLKIENFLSTEFSLGKTEIDGDKFFANVDEYMTKSMSSGHPETHDRYVDVQIVLEGEEYVFYHPRLDLKKIEQDDTKDYIYYEQPEEFAGRMMLNDQYALIFFPKDGHMPSILVGKKSTKVKKVVFKIDKVLFLPT